MHNDKLNSTNEAKSEKVIRAVWKTPLDFAAAKLWKAAKNWEVALKLQRLTAMIMLGKEPV